ncbi:MAG: MSHA biogenesis protein MshE [Gammaproteobacteria bacterium]|nr:MAG: MSHA biogenesis protein MshE [Gammaproteobacteria bacterium]
MNQKRRIRLGDLLVEHGVITQAQLEEALAAQKKSGKKLGRVLIDQGILTEEQLARFLSEQLGLPYVDLAHYQFEPEVVRLLPEIHARRFRAIPLKQERDGLLVGIADPTNLFAYDEISRILQQPVKLAVVRESDLLRSIDMLYRRTEEISGFAEALGDELEEGIDVEALVAQADVADAPVVRLIQSLFEDAVQVGASDIHIEPDERVLRIRQRIDGVLHEQVMDEKRIASALVLRLKLMANLDIAEKRLPQDGRFTMTVRGHHIDVRLSTMPIATGESVVMRLLDQTAGVLEMEQLGMPEDILTRFDHLVHRPYGMVLVTGPTGSGKTTTLYSALKRINRPQLKIITVEDPVEYRLPRVNQVQVNPDIDLTFSRVLRSALRQDPDVILIGEMRDEETAEIGLRAAMTGHLVLSTLHTNDAVSTVSRLLDMGAPPYLLAASLNAILAQRLVRRVCEYCKEEWKPEPQELAWLRANAPESALAARFVHGAGCAYCNNTGYRGRIGVYELLEIDRELALVLGRGDSPAFAEQARRAQGYRPLEQVALVDALKGITTLHEVMRISAEGLDEPEAGTERAEAG